MEREIAVGLPLTSLEVILKVTLNFEKHRDIMTKCARRKRRTVEEARMILNRLAVDTTTPPSL